MTSTDIGILIGLAVVTALYAAVLHRWHNAIHPDWTWLTVVGGMTLVMSAAELQRLLGSANRSAVANRNGTLAALVVAGAIIITWQVWLNQARIRAAIGYRRRQSRDDDDKGGTPNG